MKIIDKNDVEITNPDLSRGYLKEDTIIKHHDAVVGVEEQWHYETIAKYPNGGKVVEKIIDVPGVAAKEAWDEEIPVYRYVPYTVEELEAIAEAKKEQEANKPVTWDELDAAYQEGVDSL